MGLCRYWDGRPDVGGHEPAGRARGDSEDSSEHDGQK